MTRKRTTEERARRDDGLTTFLRLQRMRITKRLGRSWSKLQSVRLGDDLGPGKHMDELEMQYKRGI